MAETKGEVSAPLACKFVQTGPPDEDGIFYCGYCNRPKEGEAAAYVKRSPALAVFVWVCECGRENLSSGARMEEVHSFVLNPLASRVGTCAPMAPSARHESCEVALHA